LQAVNTEISAYKFITLLYYVLKILVENPDAADNR